MQSMYKKSSGKILSLLFSVVATTAFGNGGEIINRIDSLKSKLEAYRIKTGSIKTLDSFSIDSSRSLENKIEHPAKNEKLIVLFHDESTSDAARSPITSPSTELQAKSKTISVENKLIMNSSDSPSNKNIRMEKTVLTPSRTLLEATERLRELINKRKEISKKKL
ncbi:MAG: hypothetical protein HQM10_17190 [Candidatus Riflebacteria bacterium]|nr:hypothetical protein [Candidatus Riflebacteria bacterium]